MSHFPKTLVKIEIISLFHCQFSGDFALVKAWKADKAGNLIFNKNFVEEDGHLTDEERTSSVMASIANSITNTSDC